MNDSNENREGEIVKLKKKNWRRGGDERYTINVCGFIRQVGRERKSEVNRETKFKILL